MALASDLNPGGQTWKGRTGRVYRNQGEGMPRRGSKATVRAVLATGGPLGTSTPAEGAVLALKLPWKGNPEAPDAIDREGVVLSMLTERVALPPCPQLYDALEEERPGQSRPRITGLIMEWCPENLESWWVSHHKEEGALPLLCEALAQVCERVSESSALIDARLPAGQPRPTARLKPRNIAAGGDGRWLLTDFEEVVIKSLYDEHLSATQPLLGGENYLAPEVIFGATRHPSAAQDTWSVGCMLYALLRVRPYIHAGAALPADGTNSPHFRTHRMHLVTDLHTRKSGALSGRELDPALFLYADRLPDQDRRAVLQSLEGIFGERDEAREATLSSEVIRVLDRALRIDPGQRYTNPAEMAGELRGLGQMFTKLVARGRSDAMMDEATLLMPSSPMLSAALNAPTRAEAPKPEAPKPEPVRPAPPKIVEVGPRVPPASAPPNPPPPISVSPTSAAPAITEPTRIGDMSVVPTRRAGPPEPSVGPAPTRAGGPTFDARLQALEHKMGEPRPRGLPTWIKVLLAALVLSQLAMCGVIAALLLRR